MGWIPLRYLSADGEGSIGKHFRYSLGAPYTRSCCGFIHLNLCCATDATSGTVTFLWHLYPAYKSVIHLTALSKQKTWECTENVSIPLNANYFFQRLHTINIYEVQIDLS